MKKVALTLAGLLTAAAFAPEAAALPAFARQTGMACTACHFQHFPVLNGFGQAFRASGYTLMGAQNKVEGEHLSIPESLNAAFLLKVRYQKTDGTSTGVQNELTTGQLQMPDEYSLFFGGRIADTEHLKVGFLTENAPAGGAAGIFNGIKVPMVVDAGVANVLVIPYITDALGVAYGFEQSSTGATRGIRWAEHRKDISAAQYTGIASGTASGIALVANTDMGYVNFSKWAPQIGFGGGTNSPALHYLRVAATPTVADWAMHIGYGMIGGTLNGGAVAQVAKGSMFDVQAQGQIAGMDTSFYFTQSVATKSSATESNMFNASSQADRTAIAFGVDVTVIPHTLSVGFAMRNGKTEGADGVAAGVTPANFIVDPLTGAVVNTGGVATAAVAPTASQTDNSILLSAVYDIAMNVALVVNHSIYSGTANTAAGSKSLTTFMLETAY